MVVATDLTILTKNLSVQIIPVHMTVREKEYAAEVQKDTKIVEMTEEVIEETIGEVIVVI